METTPLTNLSKVKGNKRIIVECEIVDQPAPKIFKINDGDTTIDLEIKQENPNHVSYLEVGKKLKIINPEYVKKSNKLMIVQKTGIFQIGIGKKSISDSAPSLLGYETLEKIETMDMKATIRGKFLLKVVQKKNLRKVETKYGPTKLLPLVVKDLYGKKNILSIWPSHKNPDLVIEGKVYIVSNIMTDKYPDEKPFYICSRKYFRMDIAPQDFQEKKC